MWTKDRFDDLSGGRLTDRRFGNRARRASVEEIALAMWRRAGTAGARGNICHMCEGPLKESPLISIVYESDYVWRQPKKKKCSICWMVGDSYRMLIWAKSH